ncbi:MAG TPA: FliH/SctL family protein [Rhizomicrobium sp.]
MSASAKPVSKFTFDTEFRAEGDLISNAARARQRKVFTQEEIDQMCAKAREMGLKAGQVRAAEAAAAAIADLAKEVRAALAGSHDEIEIMREEAAQIALAAARKFAPAAIAALPCGDVEATLREAMHQAIGEPRIVLRASPAVSQAIAESLAAIAHEEGFEGRIVAKADPAITGADCRVEWRGGGAERSLSALEETIGELIARRFAQTDKTTTKG